MSINVVMDFHMGREVYDLAELDRRFIALQTFLREQGWKFTKPVHIEMLTGQEEL